MGIACCKKKNDDEADDAEGLLDSDDKLAVEELLQDAEEGEGGMSLEFSIECRGLPDKDKFSRSDPFCICFLQEGDDHAGRQMLGRTETVLNCLTPIFTVPIMCSVSSDLSDKVVTMEVYHERSRELDYDEQVFMGECKILLKDLMDTIGQQSKLPLANDRLEDAKAGFGLAFDKAAAVAGQTLNIASNLVNTFLTGGKSAESDPHIYVTVERALNVQEEVVIELSGSHLERPKTQLGFGKSALANYFLVVSRVQGTKMMPVAKTNVVRQFFTKDTIQKGSNPDWKPLRSKTFRICNNNFECPLLFQLFDYNQFDGGSHQLIGQARTTLAALRSGAVESMALLNEEKLGDKKYINSGEIIVRKCKLLTSYSFLDYVKRGFEINCTIAIDFSASNGKASDHPESLHFIDPVDPVANPNDYTQAIKSVCKIIGRYDKDQMFPVFGFGAKFMKKGVVKVENCFPVSMDKKEVEIQGEAAIVRKYINCVEKVIPAEPTKLAPVIRNTLEEAKENSRDNPDQPGYSLLVVLTDGQIDDMTETIDVLVECSYHAMSVLVVGIGEGEEGDGFTQMKYLDETKLRSHITGRPLRRDVVNFVSWNDNKGRNANDFARACLSEVPKHFLSWVEMSGFSLDKVHDEEHAGVRTHSDPQSTAAESVVSQLDLGKYVLGVEEVEVGKQYIVHGLVGSSHLNGEVGTVVRKQDSHYVIELSEGECAMAPSNLKPSPNGDMESASQIPVQLDGNSHYTPPQLASLDKSPRMRKGSFSLEAPKIPLSPPAAGSEISASGTRSRKRSVGSLPDNIPNEKSMKINPYGPAVSGRGRGKLIPPTIPTGSSSGISFRGGMLNDLQREKTTAVNKEDFDQAESLKHQINSLKSDTSSHSSKGFAAGTRVVLRGLYRHKDLNNKKGTLVQLLPDNLAVVDMGMCGLEFIGERTISMANVKMAPPEVQNPPMPPSRQRGGHSLSRALEV